MDLTAQPERVDEMLALTNGHRGVPVIVVGQTVIRGYDRERISELLNLGAAR